MIQQTRASYLPLPEMLLSAIMDDEQFGASKALIDIHTKVAYLHTDIDCGSANAVCRTTTSIAQMQHRFLIGCIVLRLKSRFQVVKEQLDLAFQGNKRGRGRMGRCKFRSLKCRGFALANIIS